MSNEMSYNFRRFQIYDKANPEVWQMFEFFALEAAKSTKRYSSRAIFHRIRWETMVSGDGEFKINNNWSKYYALKFMAAHPQHSGFFQTRSSGTLEA